MSWFNICGLFNTKKLLKEKEDVLIQKEIKLKELEQQLEWRITLVVDKESNLYKRDSILKINESLMKLRIQCAEDIGNYEHEFHQTKENLKCELAKLEAKIEAIKQTDILTVKDDEIKRLESIISNILQYKQSI